MTEETLENKISFLFDVLKRYDQYIATANAKANLLFAFISVVVFGVVLRISTLSELGLSCFTVLFSTMSLLTILACLYSAWLLVDIVLPDLSTDSNSKSLIFFGDVAQNSKAEEYIALVRELDNKNLLNDLSTQVYFVAKVTKNKFDKITKASNVVKNYVLPLLLILIFLFVLGSLFNG